MPLAARSRRTFWLPALVSAASLAALATIFVQATYGLSPAWLWLLLAVPLTFGLPTTCGALAVVGFWNGPPLWLGLGLAATAGFALQWSTHRAIRRLRLRSPA